MGPIGNLVNMGYIRNLFKSARTITDLERDLLFEERKTVLAETEKVRIEQRLVLVEADLTRERKAHNLALRRVADVVCRQAKLPQHFADDVAEHKEPEPEVLSYEQEQKIQWLAGEHRSWDIGEQGEDNVRPLDVYIDAIKNDPVKLQEALLA